MLKNNQNYEIDLPLFEELSQSSQGIFHTWSETLRSRDVCLNSFKNGFFIFLGGDISDIIFLKNNQNYEIDLPLFEELSQSSQGIFHTWSETLRSRDVCPNSFKNGLFIFWGDIFFAGTTTKIMKSTCHFLRN